MQTQRIVHLSDSHLPPREDEALSGCYPHRTLKLVVQEIANLNPKPEAILVTGDMTDGASEREYALFQEQLKPLSIPIYWIPGNHDDTAVMSNAIEQQYFSAAKSVSLGDWQLLLLDSHIVGEDHGHISATEFAFLSTELKRHSNRPTLVALHHTPCSPCVSFGCQLDNHEEFLALLKTHPQVKLVLAGHTHHAEKTSLDGFDVFTAPSTFAQFIHLTDEALFDPENPFALHHRDGSRVGFSVFDLKADGNYSEQLHWIEVKEI